MAKKKEVSERRERREILRKRMDLLEKKFVEGQKVLIYSKDEYIYGYIRKIYIVKSQKVFRVELKNKHGVVEVGRDGIVTYRSKNSWRWLIFWDRVLGR